MCHADSLSRCFSAINKQLVLIRDIIRAEQVKDALLEKYRQQEHFGVDEDNIL
jgi:hypothetical protein